MQESRTKARSAQQLPGEALKNAVDALNIKLEDKEQERIAAEEARNLFQLERVCLLKAVLFLECSRESYVRLYQHSWTVWHFLHPFTSALQIGLSHNDVAGQD